MTEVLVGVPTFNGYQRVDWLLQSIYKSMANNNTVDYKIIIIDDSGNKEHQEKTRSVVYKWGHTLNVGLLINEKNFGVSKSWNNIINSEDSKYIILINDDIITNKGWLENMLYFLENNPSTGAVYYGFAKIEESNIQQLLSSNNQSSFNNITPIRCMNYVGCFFGFSRDKYNLVGGFDENYFANFEETDFSTTLAAYGYPSYVLKYPTSWHIWSATFKSAPEIDYRKIYKESGQYYINKWNGDTRTNTKRYMSQIPFKKVKWIYDSNIYEEILTDDYGYFKIELEGDNVKIVS